MTSKSPLKLSNHEVEARAIEAVIARERAAGRTARDTHAIKGARVDVESKDDEAGERRLTEIKAFGGTGRGDTLWLVPNQIEALEEVPGSHLYLVTNVRAADPSEICILDLTGEQLKAQLDKKKEKRYFEVPLPVALYDDLVAHSRYAPTLDGTQFCLQILDGVVALHERGFHARGSWRSGHPIDSMRDCSSAVTKRCPERLHGWKARAASPTSPWTTRSGPCGSSRVPPSRHGGAATESPTSFSLCFRPCRPRVMIRHISRF